MIAITLMAENSISIKNACIYPELRKGHIITGIRKITAKKHIKHRISDEIINMVIYLVGKQHMDIPGYGLY
jgi:hypothetical protein